VYTAFSGSHQDAIKKGFGALADDYDRWAVPYLPIDPKHVGRSYEAVIRVNSQSGKGGVAYVMKEEHGFDLPRRLQIEFSKTIQHITEDSGTEITPTQMWESFQGVYFPEKAAFKLNSQDLHTTTSEGSGHTTITAHLNVNGEDVTVTGEGDGPVEAFVQALRDRCDVVFDVVDYSEHAIGSGADAKAVAYVESTGDDGVLRWGIGVDANITTASLLAVLAAFERQHG
jgi:2-isopropylmalate synthase